MVHDMLLVEVKKPDESKVAWDYYKVLSTIAANDAVQPLDQSKCAFAKK
jgi:branched-chain amino acid transport system substrate-binding protein